MPIKQIWADLGDYNAIMTAKGANGKNTDQPDKHWK